MSEHTAENDAPDEDEQECGNVYDHDTVTTYEDDEILQWECRRCGAEGYEDKEPTRVTPPAESDDECVVEDCVDLARNGFTLCHRHLDAADDTSLYTRPLPPAKTREADA